MTKETRILQVTDQHAKEAGYFVITGLHIGSYVLLDPLHVKNGQEIVIRQHEDSPMIIEVIARARLSDTDKKAEMKRLRSGIRDALDLLSDGPGGPRRLSAMRLLADLVEGNDER